MRSYSPPPIFRGKVDEDLEDWYERCAVTVNWSDTQKANNLVITLEEEARNISNTAAADLAAVAGSSPKAFTGGNV